MELHYTKCNTTELVILTEYKALGIRFIFQHVKSHQDDNKALQTITLKLRLNIEADKLATEYMVEDKVRQPTVSLFPTAQAQLIMNETSITRKLPNAIRFAAGSKDIRIYLMKQNVWTLGLNTLDSVNWEAHVTSHSYHRPHQKC
jgi:hypothetical protein